MFTSLGQSLSAKLLFEQVKTTGQQSIAGSKGPAGLAAHCVSTAEAILKHIKSQSYVSAQYLLSHISQTSAPLHHKAKNDTAFQELMR